MNTVSLSTLGDANVVDLTAAPDAANVIDLTTTPGDAKVIDLTDAPSWRPSVVRSIVRRHLPWPVPAAFDLLGVAAGVAAANAIVGDTAPSFRFLYPCIVLAVILSFTVHGLYDRSRLADASAEARLLFRAIFNLTFAGIALAFVANTGISRMWTALVCGLVLGLSMISRLCVRVLVHQLASRGHLGVPTLIVGGNDEGERLARQLGRGRWVGYEAVGFVVPDSDQRRTIGDLPVVARFGDVESALAATGAGAVIVANTALDGTQVAEVCEALQNSDVEVRLTTGLPSLAAAGVAVEPLDGLAMLSLRRRRRTTSKVLAKRAFDLIGAGGILLLVAPVMAMVAAAIRVTSGKGVIFKQERVGEGGEPFTIYKFRTMVHGADVILEDLQVDNEADGVLFKIKDDPRITAVGHHLRRWCLDELPQLWNVVKGDMSLVGPRPPLPHEVARYTEWVAGRLRVKPGLTGLWQVSGRHELSFDDYVRYDLFYVENHSLGLDAAVCLRTLPALLARRGAY